MLAGTMPVVLVTLGIAAIASQDMSTKGQWICAALTVASIASGFLSGALTGF
jgi:hypothetical protein